MTIGFIFRHLFVFVIFLITTYFFISQPVFGADIVGGIQAPDYLTSGYGEDVTGTGGMGIIGLISNIVKTIIVIAGLFGFFNLIFAGFTFIYWGDKPDELSKANQRMYMSLVGLTVMVGSFALAGIIGWIVFGDATAILNPKIYGPNL